MSSKISVAYAVVAAVVGHVVICTKGADLAVRGIEKLAAHIERKRIEKRARTAPTGVVIEGEYTVVR